MAQLIVRKVGEGLVQRLKQRAVAHGRSAEAEHRAILEAALSQAGPDEEAFIRQSEQFCAETAGRRMTSSLTLLRSARRRGT